MKGKKQNQNRDKDVQKRINNTLNFTIVYFNLFVFYPPFPITFPDFSNGHYFPVCLIRVTGLFDYQICMYLKLVHCTTD